jgi:hypothetical protein
VLVPGAEILLDLDGRADGEEPANEGGGPAAERQHRLTVAAGPPDVPLQLLVGVSLWCVEADQPGSLPATARGAEPHGVAVTDELDSGGDEAGRP